MLPVSLGFGQNTAVFSYTCRWVCKQVTLSVRVFVWVCFFVCLFLVELFSSWQLTPTVYQPWQLLPATLVLSSLLAHNTFEWTNGWSLWSYSCGNSTSDEFSDRFFINLVQGTWFCSLAFLSYLFCVNLVSLFKSVSIKSSTMKLSAKLFVRYICMFKQVPYKYEFTSLP